MNPWVVVLLVVCGSCTLAFLVGFFVGGAEGRRQAEAECDELRTGDALRRGHF